MAQSDYAHPELLASTEWLAQHLNDPKVKILDARSAGDYAEGHIPGAIVLPNGTFRGAGGSDLCTAQGFAETAGSLGITPSDTVVCYDAAGPQGGRAWWVFAHFGHPDVHFLNGGWRRWQGSGQPVSTDPATPAATIYALEHPEDLYCSLDEAVESVGKDDVLFWDVRSAGEFEGTEARGNPEDRLGRLPRAVHLEWNELVDLDTGLFKPADEMRRILTAKGITPDANVVTY
jgi:thiosulfate/3-mercaptopyruvate sulfurtransferase